MAENTPSAETALAAAMAAFQAEIKNPEKTKDADAGKYKYKYADIGDVLEAVLPVLSKHGLSLTQPTKIVENSIILETRVTHKDGGSLSSEYPVCSLNGNHQAMGSAMTYARRYALTSLIGIAAVEDTDGEGAADVGDGPRSQMTSFQAKEEINWAEIESSIMDATTFKKLDNRAERIEQRKGFWPDTYYHKAKELIAKNRLELAQSKMGEAKDKSELADAYEQIDGALDGKINSRELTDLYRAAETKLTHGAFQ